VKPEMKKPVVRRSKTSRDAKELQEIANINTRIAVSY
jgi:hypothetical protein